MTESFGNLFKYGLCEAFLNSADFSSKDCQEKYIDQYAGVEETFFMLLSNLIGDPSQPYTPWELLDGSVHLNYIEQKYGLLIRLGLIFGSIIIIPEFLILFIKTFR